MTARPSVAAVMLVALLSAPRGARRGDRAGRAALGAVAGALFLPPFNLWSAGLVAALAGWASVDRVVRAVGRRRRRAWRSGLRTLLVGAPDEVRDAAQLFSTWPDHGVLPVATATADGTVPTVLPGGPYDDLDPLVRAFDVQHVVALSEAAAAAVATTFDRRRPDGLRVSVLPPMAELLTAAASVVDVRGLPFVTVAPRRPTHGPAWVVKRVMDFALATVAIAAFAPLFALVALAIRLDDGGPVLFRQRRVGRNGRLFDLWKFRSMVVDAEDMVDGLSGRNEADGPYFKMENDPRVTRIGAVLRRYAIDELPQLLNVLRGEMSLVGPRPFLPSEMESDPATFEWRLGFQPGMTGLWQVAGRSWLPLREGLRMDLAYVEHWSPVLDFRILWRTALVALSGTRRPPVVRITPSAPLERARYVAMVEGDTLEGGEPCDVSIVVVSHESAGDIEGCLASIVACRSASSVEVIVVDNASTDGTADLAAAHTGVRVIRKRVRSGFSTNVNIGAVASSGRHLLVLNADTRLRDGVVDNLIAHLRAHPGIGLVGPRLEFPDGSFQHSARRFPTPLTTLVRRTPLRLILPHTAGVRRHLMADLDGPPRGDVDWVLGAAIAIRREAFDSIGGFDEAFRLYCEDIDLCWRLQEHGWRVCYLPTAVVEHALGEHTYKRFLTVRTVWHVRSMVRFVRLHGLQRRPALGVDVAAPQTIDLRYALSTTADVT